MLLIARSQAINVVGLDERFVATFLATSNAMNIVVTAVPAVRHSQRTRLAIRLISGILSCLSLLVAVLFASLTFPVI